MDDQKQNAPDAGDFQQALLKLQACVELALQDLERGELEKARETMLKAFEDPDFKKQLHLVVHHSRTDPRPVPEGSKIIEGVFDGQYMVGSDGKKYLVPPNYASKSKLVEGDLLKLSITPDGAFVYKQISPIERRRVFAVIEEDANGMFYAVDGALRWKLLSAAMTYFKGRVGDKIVILVPAETPSQWAAVENIIAR